MLNHLMPSGNFNARKFGMGFVCLFVCFFFFLVGGGVIFSPGCLLGIDFYHHSIIPVT